MPQRPALTATSHRALPVTWMAGVFPLAVTVAGRERTVRALLVAETGDEGRIVTSEILPGDAIANATAALVACADGDNEYERPVLPREIRFLDGALFAVAGPVFARAGVRCRHVPHQPELDEMADDLARYMTDRLRGVDFDLDDDEEGVLGDDDEDGDEWNAWGRALSELIELGHITLRSRNLSEARLHTGYVGHPDLGAKLFGPGAPAHLVAPLSVWSMACYRPTPRSKTVLETVLERKTLPDEVRQIAESLRDATPSLYEVVETRESVIGLRDVATGDVHAEVMLPMPTRVGSIWPGIVHAAGPFFLLAPIGPAIPPTYAADTPDTLADWGIAVTRDALARHHHFGGLIAWWIAETDAYALDDPHKVDEAETETGERAGADDTADGRLIEVHRQMQRRWLDAQIPAFDGRTPREMCETDEGRRAVAELIRGLRNPSPRIPEAAHREMVEDLLDELGLT